MLFGLHIIDILVLVAYLAGVTMLGFWSIRKVKGVGKVTFERIKDHITVGEEETEVSKE